MIVTFFQLNSSCKVFLGTLLHFIATQSLLVYRQHMDAMSLLINLIREKTQVLARAHIILPGCKIVELTVVVIGETLV